MFYIDEFLVFLKDKLNYKSSTARNYWFFLKRFERFNKAIGITAVKTLSCRNVLEFLEAIKKRSRSERVHYCRFCAMRVYFNFLQERGFIFFSPLSKYRYPKFLETHFPILSQEEIETILAGIKEHDDTCIKGKVMLELFYSSALRPREIINLKVRDIEFEKGELFIFQSKGKKDRIVPVGRKALDLVERYINTTRKKYIKGRSPENVFLDFKTGKPHNAKGIRIVLDSTLKRNGFRYIKPYSLRGTAATVLFLNGMGITHICKLLGHVKLSTTTTYIRIDDKALKKELKAKHPRLKIKENNE